VDFTFKAVSQDPWLQEDFMFMAVDDPSASLVSDGAIPGIQGMLPINDENPTPRMFNFSGLLKVQYREVVNTLLKFYPEKYDDFQEYLKVEEFRKQNPTGEIADAKRPVPRQFQEITSTDDWKKSCINRKACAIGLLPAITEIDYELESFEDKLEILE
jgi:hypothetical protein